MNIAVFISFIFICIAFSIIEYYNNKSIKIFSIIAIFFFVLLVTFRSKSTPDTTAYINYFESISTDIWSTFSSLSNYWESEIGYTLLNQFIKSNLGNNYKILFAIIPVINLAFIYSASKNISSIIFKESIALDISHNELKTKRKNQRFLLFMPLFALYVSYYGFMYSGIVLRAGLAISILIFAYSKILQGRYILSLLLSVVSIAFHQTALIGIIAILFTFIKFKTKKSMYYFIWLVLGLIYMSKIWIYFAPLISNYVQIYLFATESKTMSLFSEYLDIEIFFYSYSYMVLIMLVNFFISIRYIKETDAFRSLLNISLFGLTLLVLFGSITIFSRVTDFFTVFNFLLFYFALNNMNSKLYKSIFISWIIITNSIFFYRLAGG
jgi:hypothetical protein